ncbi:MAG: acyltransferase [Lacunisphaera sp.]|nr:acyltransferase [Lacunisphaera sp.]
MKHTYYPSLDGLRTVAVGIVMCAHGGVPWFRSGGVGVDIFFVLSGFLITTILSTESARTGSISFRNFYARRMLRLAPALLLTGAFVAAGMGWLERRFPATELAFALSYTANWALAFYNYQLTWLNHCWSLAVEEQFYLLWPLVIVLLERTGRSPAAKARLLIIGALLIALYRASRVGIYPNERINFGLDTRMDTLMTGAALAYFVQSLPGGRLPDAASRALGRWLAPLALAGLLLVIHTVTWYSPWMGWIGYVLVAGAAMLVIADLVAGAHSRLARPLAWGPMVFIGKISYGLYLVHLPVYYMVEKLIPAAPLLVRLGVKVPVSVLLAVASYYLVERRFLRMKSRFETPAGAR